MSLTSYHCSTLQLWKGWFYYLLMESSSLLLEKLPRAVLNTDSLDARSMKNLLTRLAMLRTMLSL
jgi:hypothetical protein